MDERDAVRTLSKWLNEEQVAPIDRVALATVLAAWNRRAEAQVPGWQPIETAPRDNKAPLLLAQFNEDGTLQSFDYNGSWASDRESWEIPQVYYYWETEKGNVEEPTHWMYQPDWFAMLAAAPEVKQ